MEQSHLGANSSKLVKKPHWMEFECLLQCLQKNVVVHILSRINPVVPSSFFLRSNLMLPWHACQHLRNDPFRSGFLPKILYVFLCNEVDFLRWGDVAPKSTCQVSATSCPAYLQPHLETLSSTHNLWMSMNLIYYN